MNKAVVCGAGGFIGSHLIKYLKEKGYWVRGVDLYWPKWSDSKADEFMLLDLRHADSCRLALNGADEVYNLAADMGGMGFIGKYNYKILRNNSLININTLETCKRLGIRKYFFSSSACAYPMDRLEKIDAKPIKEEEVLPANPQGGYGWEKLIHEFRCKYLSGEHGFQTRVARFFNTYGPEGTYEGERAKAPAALCRKVIEAEDEIEVWGDGKTTRCFTYIDDTVEGVYRLMQSGCNEPVHIGNPDMVSIEDLVKLIIEISGKDLKIKYVDGPQGVRGRRPDNTKIQEVLEWQPSIPLRLGMKKTYKWIERQLNLSS